MLLSTSNFAIVINIMGSWHETCFLTGLAIRPGDKCRIIILEGKYNNGISSGGLCYSNDVYSPKSMPLLGKYDDCGDIILDDANSIYAQQLLSSLKEDMVDKPNTEYPIEKCSNLYDYFNVIERGYGLYRDNHLAELLNEKEIIRPIDFIMVLEESYAATQKINIDKWEQDQGMVSYSINEIAEKIKQDIINSSERLNNFITRTGNSMGDLMYSYCFREIKSFFGVYGFERFNFPLEQILNKYKNNESIEDDCLEIAKFAFFYRDCALMRKAFLPCAGKGSQMDKEQWDILNNMSETVQNIISKRKIQYEEMYGEDEE